MLLPGTRYDNRFGKPAAKNSPFNYLFFCVFLFLIVIIRLIDSVPSIIGIIPPIIPAIIPVYFVN